MLLVRAARQGETSSHTDDMRQPQARTCAGCGGHAEGGCQQHEQYPAGAWLGPWPSRWTPPHPASLCMLQLGAIVPSRVCLALSWPADLSTPLLRG